jgi:hypothetical protein
MASFFQNMFIRRPRAIHPVATSPVATSPVAQSSIIEIANRWVENPLVNPYTQEVIEVSIHPTSAYVKLYKKVMRDLIKDLLTHYKHDHILTLEDCKYIKDNLPIIHSIIEITKKVYIRYDHLFIRYFVKNMKAYRYNIKYCEDSEIKLHLNIYNSIKTKYPTSLSQSPRASLSSHSPQSPSSRSFAKENYKTIEDLLKNNIDFSKTDISIGKLIVNMCVDIRSILYMRNADITEDNYRIARHNKKTLEYVNYFYNLNFADKSDIYKKIIDYYKNLGATQFPDHNIEEIKHIYEEIISNMDTRTGYICPELIHIYNKYILCLYARHFNQFIDLSTKIKDEYEDEGKTSNSDDKIKLNPYCPKDIKDHITQEEISDLGDTKRKYVANMIFYDTKIKKVFYYCYDTVYLYNYILHKYIAASVKDKNDEDILNEILIDDVADIPKNPLKVPFTDEELDEICSKVKFLTDKPTYNSHIDIKEAIIQRYMAIVRRLLNTIYLKEPDDITYNDSIDWKETRDLLLNYKEKYDDNYLLLVQDTELYKNEKANTIKGEYRAYIAINFGNLSSFYIINPLINDNSNKEPYLKNQENSLILRLPMFKQGDKDAIVLAFLKKVEEGIKVGRYISNDIFPYREDDKPIIKLEPFDFLRNEDVDRLYMRFIEYASKNDYELKGGGTKRRRRGRK